MSLLAVWIGLLLTIVGIVGYFASGMVSWTALIPAILGIPVLCCGIIGMRHERMRKHVMHLALLLCLIGVAGTFRGLISAFGMLGGAEVERPEAVLAQAVTAILCLLFLVLGIRSFIRARLLKSS